MSNYYVTFGILQHHLADYYKRTGSKMQFPEMIDYLLRKNLLLTEVSHDSIPNNFYSNMSDSDFDHFVDSLTFRVDPANTKISQLVTESDIIPLVRDVFVIRHPRYTRRASHTHNYFEIDFVSNGECTFYFEGEEHKLRAGESCIIAPHSKHDLIIDDETTTVFCIMIRKSTFNTTFFSLMSQKNLLSLFFRTVLQKEAHANYLRFYSDEIKWLTSILRNTLVESHRSDPFSNNNCISWINLFFSHLIRNYSTTVQFYNYQMGTDFSLILQYIQHNYQTLTLASLAEFFHYSEPYLSTQIKQNTGCSFTTLVKQLRMADAVSYLTNTNMKISEIAETVGYNSADHFSRVFRSSYKMSPQDYRKARQAQSDVFVPFEQLES